MLPAIDIINGEIRVESRIMSLSLRRYVALPKFVLAIQKPPHHSQDKTSPYSSSVSIFLASWKTEMLTLS